jgi:acetylornithine deacetylase/succinyl-diaminopimelate desuccinylase-like protein
MFDNQGTTLGNKIGRLGNHILIEEVMDTDDSSIATNSLEIDIHVPLFTSTNQIITEIYETLKSLLDRSMNIEILYKYEPSYSALTERMYILLSKNVSNIGVRELLPLCTLARSDATYFRRHRIPTYLYGPGNPILAHRPNEWVNFFDVIDVASVIAKTCIDMLEQNLDKRG